MTDCTLCGLPTPDPPITDETEPGEYCCQGCLVVARQLDDVADADASTAQEILTDDDAANEEGEEAFVAVDGMHCATCEAFLEGQATNHDGVNSAEASYAAELVRVTYDPDELSEAALPDVLSGLGYDASHIDDRGATRDNSPPWRLLIGAFCGMMVMMWYVIFLYPYYFGFTPADAAWTMGPKDMFSQANVWGLTTIVLLYTGYPILRGAYVSLRAGQPNMDLLVALAAVNAYIYSIAVILTGGAEIYFDITVVVVLVVTLGGYYEDRIKRRATARLQDLTEQQVDTARRRTADGTEEVAVEELAPGDEVVVRPGERIPVDGTVADGTAAVDESLVTGESVPVRKEAGDEVIGGAVVTDDALVVTVGEDATSTLDRLVRLLWRVQSSRPGAQRFADKLATVFVPLVLGLAVVASGWQLLSGAGATEALLTGLAVLVVSCPCALGLATPLAVAAGIRDGLDRGLVVRDASVFETAAKTDLVAFDKTGTLTTGQMRVIEAADEAAMQRAAAVEQFASHPIGAAITDQTSPPDRSVTDFETHPGRGVSATVGEEQVIVGHPGLFTEQDWGVPEELTTAVSAARSAGRVPVLVGWDGRARSVVVVGDHPRPEWEQVVTALSEAGHDVAVITGDSDRAAARFHDHPDIDQVFANVRPEAKAEVVEQLGREKTVTMVGDGSNDAPALGVADLGIALGSGTAMAADAADVVVTTDDLHGVPAVFELTTATKRRIRQNLGWALLYNAVAIPMAILGHINPLVAAVAMASSSLLVVGNSARPLLEARDADTDSADTTDNATSAIGPVHPDESA